MKVFITGASGLVCSRFYDLYKDQYNLYIPSQIEVDITDRNRLHTYVTELRPDAIVHAAAFTDVDAAEHDRGNINGPAWRLNVVGTENIAEISKANGVFLVHISTDGVFSGSREIPGPYDEYASLDASPDILSWYGWTKAEAERKIHSLLENCAIIRISNPVRADFYRKKDYIQKILDLYQQNRLHPLFFDQFLTLTFIDEFAHSLHSILANYRRGIFHVSSRDCYTPFALASYVIARAIGRPDVVIPKTSMSNFIAKTKNASRYPQYGGLQVSRTEKILCMNFLSWREIVDRIVPYSILK